MGDLAAMGPETRLSLASLCDESAPCPSDEPSGPSWSDGDEIMLSVTSEIGIGCASAEDVKLVLGILWLALIRKAMLAVHKIRSSISFRKLRDCTKKRRL